jgi:DNA (cytosine-5)-methyltransferase 1
MNELALFAGAGGGILGGKLLGWRTVCAVEWEPYPASVLCARQNDGLLPPFPIWDDVQTFDGRPWRGIVDVVSGGFPCQDISSAGKGAGIEGERSGMWKHMARVVSEVRPRFVFVENSPMLIHRGLARVLGDLATLGYDSRWTVMGAADVGAPHQRDRLWLVAYSKSIRYREGRGAEDVSQKDGRQNGQMRPIISRSSERPKDLAHSNGMRELQPPRSERKEWNGAGISGKDLAHAKCLGSHSTEDEQVLGRTRAGQLCLEQSRNYWRDWWTVEPNVGRVANGVAARVDRLKAIGNGQVPLCAATAWRYLSELL